MEADGFGDRHPRDERMPLGEKGDAAANLRWQCANVVPEEFGAAKIGLGHPQQHANGRRLAGAISAQEAVDAPHRDVQVEVVDGALRPEELREPVSRNRIVSWRSFPHLASSLHGPH